MKILNSMFYFLLPAPFSIIIKYYGPICGSDGKESVCNAGDLGSITGLRRSLEEGMTTHSSILAWRIPMAEEPGRLQSMGHKESDMTEQLSTAQHSCYKIHWTIIFQFVNSLLNKSLKCRNYVCPHIYVAPHEELLLTFLTVQVYW